MATYRTRAELRRLHRDAPWVVAGVLIDGNWSPAAPGIAPARPQLAAAGLVTLVDLPPFIAPDAEAAATVALDTAELAGYQVARTYREAPHWADYGGGTISIELDEVLAELEADESTPERPTLLR